MENKATQDQPNNVANKKVIFKNCASFTNCISRINNTQMEDAHDIDIIMPMYNLIEYSDNFIVANVITYTFKIKEKITGQTRNDCTKDVEIMVPLKYLSNFWSTLEMPLINCEINLNLNWSRNHVTLATDVAGSGATFLITD